MKTEKIKGQIVSHPQVLTDETSALVLLVIKNDEGYKELHYNRGKFSSSATLALNFANSKFSKIATSSIGETIEAYICSSTGEIFRFKNVTRGDVECL